MANSRKSTRRSDRAAVQQQFERALEDILARVFVSTEAQQPHAFAVAYSGGLDSSLLLQLCAEYGRVHGLCVRAFHVHHALSPNADAWATHCRQVAERSGVLYEEEKVAVDRADARGIEEAARVARYAALAALCQRHKVRLLLTAHHENDQTETLLLQLARGAGLGGMAGMAQLQANHPLLDDALFLGRPLLNISRQRMADDVAAKALPYIDDESNSDPRYRRNAIRLHIMPAMESHFAGCGAAIARTARHLQAASTLLDDLAEIDFATCREEHNNALVLAPLRSLSQERVANLLRYWVRLQHGLPLSEAQLVELRAQMLSAADDAKPFLDGGSLRIWRFRGRLYARAKPVSVQTEPVQLRWAGEQVVAVPAWNGRLFFRRSEGGGLPESLLRQNDLRLMPRSGGERLKTALRRPSKPLKALYQENTVPPWQRERLPLLYAGDALVFAAGVGIDARHATAGDGIVLHWEEGLAA